MNRSTSRVIPLLFLIGLALVFYVQKASAQSVTETPVVQAILLYRSTCSHCQQLVAEILPPIMEKYGVQLQIFYCDVSQPQGDALFTAAIKRFNIKTIGIPTMIVGDNVLIGSNTIQQEFPKIIQEALDHGGLDWPDIPGFSQALATAETTATTVVQPPAEFLPVFPAVPPIGNDLPLGSQSSSSFPIIRTIAGMGNNFSQDPLGNTVSVVILAGLIISLIVGIRTFLKQLGAPLSRQLVWVIPGLCAIGCGIAGYLAYVEMTSAEAICGPVGHCQAVQQSAYARLFGVLPVGLLGLAGYVAVLITWFIRRFVHSKWAELASLVLLGITSLGTLFSVYLTFLEPFVIGASCLWCLTSAVLMTALFYLNIAPGKLAYTHLLKKLSDPAIPSSL